ncbi:MULTISPECIES: hypothetical protein [unclassified Mesorhizobium]|uniref:hypothetical protein n=1 Tax=unclassified Mesorhizobium TaxID=325217 RepID=UPI000FCC20BB|nr:MULTISPECIES: hypothetical protein [unclassified Mesorhizobium]RUV11017.1 hypothetical protein EOD00_10900 [Mesorhizobium sp. M7A.T.Ca.TU.009.01.3.1]RUV51918.1 hypothetical protein EOB77_08925 [Mesorhizobium sp. M7A.F.Ca.MR.228.00.0.0]RWO40722.1 MAG: hypothetical protein EOS12_25095 [Mesorhizobium sp.]RUV22320.1 hypothetical protein EOB80_06750 [Mesorhizobium sp. M7A.F.Ca.MR.245.00.0.0]RUV38297.1 hypothetical protein EOB49_07355 [Mesorhizobium sp. M7A.F.Ca.MR.148.00.0.0]
MNGGNAALRLGASRPGGTDLAQKARAKIAAWKDNAVDLSFSLNRQYRAGFDLRGGQAQIGAE